MPGAVRDIVSVLKRRGPLTRAQLEADCGTNRLHLVRAISDRVVTSCKREDGEIMYRLVKEGESTGHSGENDGS